MTTPILVPQLGNEISEAEVSEWLVKAGDSVSAGQPVALLSTTKASVELEAPVAGTITALHFEEGDLVEVGATLAEIG